MSIYYSKKSDKVAAKKHLYLPPNLSVNELNRVLTGKTGTSKVQLNVCLLYTLLLKNYVAYNKEERDPERWLQIPRRAMRTMLGTEYSTILALLVSNSLLEVLDHNEDGEYFENGYYWNTEKHGGECKKYRIPAALLDPAKTYRIVPLAASKSMENKVSCLNAGGIAYDEKYRNLALANMADIVLLDNTASRHAIDELYAERKLRAGAADYLEFFNNCPLERAVVCEFGRRAHHKVVRHHKKLKAFERFCDDLASPTSEIDIVNCQPALLASINSKLIKKFAPECASAIPIFEKYQSDENYKKFQRLCFEGKIYEYLRDQFNATYSHKLLTGITRDDAKNICFTAFFSNYQHREVATPIADTEHRLAELLRYGADDAQIDAVLDTLFKKRSYALFKQEFRAVHALFSEIKALSWDFNSGEPHSNNCLLAQRIESGIIYTCFVKALVKAGITRFYTVHDAIRVKQQDEPKVRIIIEKEIQKLGLQLKLKRKVSAQY